MWGPKKAQFLQKNVNIDPLNWISLRNFEPWIFFHRPFPASFSFIFDFSIQFIVNKIYWWLDSNCGSQVLETTYLPSDPQPVWPDYEIIWLLDGYFS